MSTDIFFWSRKAEHGWLSNFWRTPIKVDGQVWSTSEHYYQAQKTFDPLEQTMIWNCAKPLEAKLAGYHVTLRPDWEEVKEAIMLTALRAKFGAHALLAQWLLETGDAALHEDSPWDEYWGWVNGRGQDRLGKLLMQVREELRAAAA
ncbi:hypothetical protein LCGC14_1048970 [marine sediment metagenome]|uniref:NADAR domain-containing protein n=1 Tax=marine sediment metagenome TaxID=412755 RepID=A0A0F9NB89_9ZZZZ